MKKSILMAAIEEIRENQGNYYDNPDIIRFCENADHFLDRIIQNT